MRSGFEKFVIKVEQSVNVFLKFNLFFVICVYFMHACFGN